jgi:hypothetical protein
MNENQQQIILSKAYFIKNRFKTGSKVHYLRKT